MVLYPATQPGSRSAKTQFCVGTDKRDLPSLQSWFGYEHEGDPSSMERLPQAQRNNNGATHKLALYHYETCWFCARVRGTIERLKLEIELRDIHRDQEHYRRLLAEGGSRTVPCLHIERDDGTTEWLYESSDICDYLERKFGACAGN